MNEILVNGLRIDEDEILREMQYHPAESASAARDFAAEWLVIRALLLDRAGAIGIKESDDETAVQAVIEREVDIPEPTEAECRRYYENNKARFRSPDLVEAAHILLSAAPGDEELRANAEARAEKLIESLTSEPERFGELARAHSDCDSRFNDGRLGQLSRGESVSEMETFLFNLEEGQLSPIPVKTRYGVHVLRVDKRVPGRVLPYEAVAEKVSDFLKEASWRRAFRQYVQILAGDAAITGFNIRGAESPLVQ
ncbi:MAG: peptidylprolyl isomerase [Albidovulum sp.]|nr:peptidylprolyl isomerase [Albidovulum sp.]MDE0308092.1 peptidylprolyl isomerase [Albidovulum sp.]MDE0532967.1 peptidylprolyl isomerase [Albidovulum sp.]